MEIIFGMLKFLFAIMLLVFMFGSAVLVAIAGISIGERGLSGEVRNGDRHIAFTAAFVLIVLSLSIIIGNSYGLPSYIDLDSSALYVGSVCFFLMAVAISLFAFYFLNPQGDEE